MKATLIEDEIILVRGVMEDSYEDILQIYAANQEKLYGTIEKELSEVHEAICSVRVVPTAPSSSETAELGDEPAQLLRPVDETEAQLQ
jgi:hypothetical protein